MSSSPADPFGLPAFPSTPLKRAPSSVSSLFSPRISDSAEDGSSSERIPFFLGSPFPFEAGMSVSKVRLASGLLSGARKIFQLQMFLIRMRPLSTIPLNLFSFTAGRSGLRTIRIRFPFFERDSPGRTAVLWPPSSRAVRQYYFHILRLTMVLPVTAFQI